MGLRFGLLVALLSSTAIADRADVWRNNLNHKVLLVRKNAALQLGRLHDTKAIPDLLTIVTGKDPDDLRITALNALLKMPRESTLKAFQTQLKKESSPRLRRRLTEGIEILQDLQRRKKI